MHLGSEICLCYKATKRICPTMISKKEWKILLQIDHECDFPVCQLRLDFLDFEIAPPTSGNCNRDQFIIRADEPLPVLCGKLVYSYTQIKKFMSSSGHPMNKQFWMVRALAQS